MADNPYQYGERSIDPMPARTLRFGEGRISGIIALTLGALSLLGALCFRFPEVFTTKELREVYNVSLLRLVLHGAMAIAFGLFGVVRSREHRRLGELGIVLVFAAYFVGGPLAERAVDPASHSASIGWCSTSSSRPSSSSSSRRFFRSTASSRFCARSGSWTSATSP